MRFTSLEMLCMQTQLCTELRRTRSCLEPSYMMFLEGS